MHIAFFTDTFLPQVNGVVRSIVATVNELVDRGNTVTVYTMEVRKIVGVGPEPFATLDKRIRIRTYFSVAALGFPEVQCRVPNFVTPLIHLQRDRPDLIHCHTNFTMAWEARWAARKLGIPLISTHHGLLAEYLRNFGLDFNFAKRWMRQHLARSYDRAAAVIAPSDALRQELQENGCRAPIHVISNPVESAMFREARCLPQRRGYRSGIPAVVHVGRLVPQKCVDTLLSAFALAVRSGFQAELVIVGAGRERAALEALSHKLGIAASVRWAGLLQGSDLIQQMLACDVFASASTTETQGLVFLEAMALGLPCVGVNAGGVPEYVRHRREGIIAAPDDAYSLSEALLELLKDPLLRQRCGAAAREHAQQFSAERIVSQLEQLYLKNAPHCSV